MFALSGPETSQARAVKGLKRAGLSSGGFIIWRLNHQVASSAAAPVLVQGLCGWRCLRESQREELPEASVQKMVEESIWTWSVRRHDLSCTQVNQTSCEYACDCLICVANTCFTNTVSRREDDHYFKAHAYLIHYTHTHTHTHIAGGCYTERSGLQQGLSCAAKYTLLCALIMNVNL